MILSSDENKEPLGVSDLPEFNANNNTSDEGQMLKRSVHVISSERS